MKKYILTFSLLLVIVPSIAFASWWNPFSWNWKALFSKSHVETVSENKEDTTSSSDSIDPTQTATNSSKIDDTIKNTELDVSNAVAEYYQSTVQLTNKQLEILSLISSEADRYVQGIPRNISDLQKMVNISFDSNIAVQLNPLLNEWGSSYVADFQKLKTNVTSYSNELKKQQSILSNVGNSLGGKYIPKSKWGTYEQEIKIYWDKINQQTDSFSGSLDSLSTAYLNEKKKLGDGIYQAGLGNLQSANIFPTSSYQPVIPYAPIYTPPIRTYCNSFGDNISCTSYSN